MLHNIHVYWNHRHYITLRLYRLVIGLLSNVITEAQSQGTLRESCPFQKQNIPKTISIGN